MKPEESLKTDHAPDAGERAVDPDELLMLRFKKGDAESFELLFSRFKRPVFNFILRYVRNGAKAEEMLQETFLRLIQNAGRYEVKAKFSTYLFRIARNLCLDHAKRAERRYETLSLQQPVSSGDDSRAIGDTFAHGGPSPQELAAQREQKETIEHLIAVLPVEQREVFLLRHVEGLKFEEIATIVGCSPNTVKSRMRYALESLRSGLRRLKVV